MCEMRVEIPKFDAAVSCNWGLSYQTLIANSKWRAQTHFIGKLFKGASTVISKFYHSKAANEENYTRLSYVANYGDINGHAVINNEYNP